MIRLAILTVLAATALMPSAALAYDLYQPAAGSVYVDVSRHEHWRSVPAWAPLTGQQIYYGTHYTQVPAYPAPDLSYAYPVPVFSGARPLPIIRQSVAGHD